MCLLCAYRTLVSCKLHKTDVGGLKVNCQRSSILLEQTGYPREDIGTVLIFLESEN